MSRDVVGMCRFMKDPEEILDYIENYRNYGEMCIRDRHRRGNGVLYGAGADHIWLVRNMRKTENEKLRQMCIRDRFSSFR